MMNLLSADDLSKGEINDIFEIADDICNCREKMSMAEGAVIALLFQKPSTRTRVSFEVRNGQARRQVHIHRHEHFADVARRIDGATPRRC